MSSHGAGAPGTALRQPGAQPENPPLAARIKDTTKELRVNQKFSTWFYENGLFLLV